MKKETKKEKENLGAYQEVMKVGIVDWDGGFESRNQKFRTISIFSGQRLGSESFWKVKLFG